MGEKRIRETLNLSLCADNSKKNIYNKKNVTEISLYGDLRVRGVQWRPKKNTVSPINICKMPHQPLIT